ncbi:DNA primase small subunit PriS [Natronomonas gomsonensis]|uniref:DNA primase small subunit PriS n=1 Tax=Natronomonas gomsonensis TaxID=1046043 RepID=UPI0020CA3175|nr:DNA primase small subunit PriS [Natronomonas gomsonensis]MCY4729100.1 DNA primase small subunit PriS [Natronomonas gomsonensis]
MDGRTREYLQGRFGDHYRRSDISPPPAANEREWGYITWSSGGTTMVRHHSHLDLVGGGDLGDFLAGERPRHVYFSAGRYDDPGASSMGKKGWRGSDLVFDLDADHLPGVDPEADSYAEMLAECKEALLRLLDLLEHDFDFDDLTVVFSGGRGYHVHVRDSGVLELSRSARREIVDYVLGEGVDIEALIETEKVSGSSGRKTPADKRTLQNDGGWGRRLQTELNAFVEELDGLSDDEAMERLTAFDRIGEGKATTMLGAIRKQRDAIEAGNIDVHNALKTIAETLLTRVLEEQTAPIDEPVTTDINRLIRLPGSLHGGSGLEVQHIPRDELDSFDPLVDAVPETFVGNDISVYVREETTVRLGGESFRLSEGVHSMPEYVGVFAMTRGHATKAAE